MSTQSHVASLILVSVMSEKTGNIIFGGTLQVAVAPAQAQLKGLVCQMG